MENNILPTLETISGLLKINKSEQFIIPDYQREYVWNIDNCEMLLNDIENIIKDEKKDYFFGTIIIDKSDSTQFKLIDGQQRITTFLLLLKALQLILENNIVGKKDTINNSIIFALDSYMQDIISILFKIDDKTKVFDIRNNWDLSRDIDILNNESMNEIHKNDLLKIIHAKDFNEAEIKVDKDTRKHQDNKYTNFFRNFTFFYEKLNSFKQTELNTFAEAFLNKCKVIKIYTLSFDQAIEIFNSLNSKGTPLSDVDIISAQMNKNAKDKKNEFLNKWHNLIKKTKILSSKRIVNIETIFQEYMYYKRAKGDNESKTPGLRKYYTEIKKELLNEPFELCDKFQEICDIWEKISEYPMIKVLLKFNGNLKLFLIPYLYRIGIDTINEKNVNEIALCLLKLFTILEVSETEYSNVKFKSFLFRENKKLVNKNVQIAEIQEDFRKHIQNEWKEEDIEFLIKECEKNSLVYLNEYLFAKEKNLDFTLEDNVNIEHIMPSSGKNIDTIRKDAGLEEQEKFDLYVNQIGNKILLEENINKHLSNAWFKTKKEKSITEKKGYCDSKYNIALSLSEYPNDLWEKEDIETATQKACYRILNFIFS